MKTFVASLACLVLLSAPVTGNAATFPDKPVEAVVAWAAGGGADLVFRAMAAVFPKYANGQPLLIKNIPGAAGVPGIMEFKKAKADGYTVLQWNNAHVIKTHMNKVPFTGTEFTPVAGVVEDYFYIVVPKDAPWKNLQEYIAYAKANPGKVNFGNAGIGGGSHFAALQFEEKTGTTATQIPFQGGGPLVTGLLNGQVEIASLIPPEGASNIQNGQFRVLAMFAPATQMGFPTAKDQGVELVVSQWRGVMAPAGTPADKVEALQNIFKQVVADPEFQKKMTDMGAGYRYMSAKEFGEAVAQDDKLTEALVKAKGLGDRYKK